MGLTLTNFHVTHKGPWRKHSHWAANEAQLSRAEWEQCLEQLKDQISQRLDLLGGAVTQRP